MHGLDARQAVEQLAIQVLQVAGAGGGEGQPPRLGFCEGNELWDVLRRHARVDDEHVGDAGDQRDRGQVAAGVVAQAVALQVGRNGDLSGGAEQQRVAIGGGADHGHGADLPGGAGAVFHDDGLGERGAQWLGQQARHDVHAAAGREGDDDVQRARLGAGGSGQEGGGGEQGATVHARRVAGGARGGKRPVLEQYPF